MNCIRSNQATLRADVYSNLVDYFANPNDGIPRIGQRIIFPSSFIGSPRNMHQNYLDAMSIVQHFGKPSLFITMTCNPNWPEIKNNLPPSQGANFRPEIVDRVFKSKVNELMDAIIKKQIFGKVEALIYTIGFQKRGLPHAHISLTLEITDRIDGIIDIDKFVSAEIPDPLIHPKLHSLVKSHMIHGPCGVLNPNCVCMVDGKCVKKIPKDFSAFTHENVNGYPVYKRRDNGMNVDVRGSSVDNRFVVPYNPYLLAKFDCHLNVEVCSTVKSVKYIYKYVYKGYDCASVQFGRVNDDVNGSIQVDEIQNFLNGRYVGSTEAAWRIFEYPMHFQTHTIIRLDCHLPERQTVYFREGNEQQAVSSGRKTKLLAFFELNSVDTSANNYLYSEIHRYYVWNDRDKKWTKRQRGAEKVIARLYVVSPRDMELYHLRLLLLHVRGPKNFQDLRTYLGNVYLTFLEASHARGIASNDNEWRECMFEAKDIQSPRQLRQLFAFICAMNVPANALALWNEFKMFMCEDFLREFSDDISFNKALHIIEEVLLSHNLSCNEVGLPTPVFIATDEPVVDIEESLRLFNEMYERGNN